MKTKISCLLIMLVMLSMAHAQGSAFLYQGRLNDNGSPATGIYDLRFTICDAVTNGNLVAGPLTNSATAVTNGLFSVTLDFGSGVFTGAARWLEVDVRTNGGEAFSTLLPLQPIQPVPYAIMANTASNLLGMLPIAQMSGTIPLAQLPGAVLTNNSSGVFLSGTFSGNGSGLTKIASVTAGTATNALNARMVIEGVGDSITAANGVTGTNTWFNAYFAKSFGALFGATVTNEAVGGTTFAQAVAAYPTGGHLVKVTTGQVGIVTALSGINSTAETSNQLSADLANLAAQVHADGKLLVAYSIYNRGNYFFTADMISYNGWLAGASNYWDFYVDLANNIDINTDLGDGLHPNPLGAEKISQLTIDSILAGHRTPINATFNSARVSSSIMAGSFIASSNQNAFVIPASGLNGQYVIGVNPLANSSGEYDYQGINTFRTGGFGYAFGSEGGFTLMGIDENGTIHGNGGALTNIPASGIAGGFNTNILVGGHTFYITNGIIMNIQ